jgi:hypothetical protein
VGKHTAETQSQRSDLLQPFPLSRAELGRAVHDKSVADYLALVKLVCIRLGYAFTVTASQKFLAVRAIDRRDASITV